jgi:hypothetical protein
MTLNSQQRGKVFEKFIRQILLNSGFGAVVPDGQIIYQAASGLMLHGLAQPHNTDVLVNPPFQIPFFFPSRLIVECKCYKVAVDLPVIRGALGLREDVNSFDIVTKEILEKRKNYCRAGVAVFDRDRYFYQVAVASLSGFTKPAQEFALVHRIPLINIERMPFSQQVRDVLFSGDARNDDDQAEQTPENGDPLIEDRWQLLHAALRDILKRFCIAILSSGDILFLYTETGGQWFFDTDEIELHWADNKRLWQIKPRDQNARAESWFELPNILFDQWAQKEFDRSEAINLKERNFQNIYVMGMDANGTIRLKVLRLSGEFITQARERLRRELE